jgi:hypothetical protein
MASVSPRSPNGSRLTLEVSPQEACVAAWGLRFRGG